MASSRLFFYFALRPVQARTPLLSRGKHEATEKRDFVTEYRVIKSKTPAILFNAEARVPESGNAKYRWKDAPSKVKLKYIYQYETNLSTILVDFYEYAKQIPHDTKFNEEEQKILDKAILFKRRELQRPKRPVNGYIMYVRDSRGKGIVPSELAKSWIDLDDTVKQKYKTVAQENLMKYKELLDSWEQEMLKQGHYLLVRKKARQEHEKD